MNYLNHSNRTNFSCIDPKIFESLSYFFTCYKEKFAPHSSIEIFLTLFIEITNVLLLIKIGTKSKKSIYDQVFIVQSITHCLIGFFLLPFFHFENTLDYWAFGDISSILWVSFDNVICMVTNFQMAYLSFLRYRSIKSPRVYQQEFLVKKPYLVMLSFWVLAILLWFPIGFYFKTFDFSSNLNYQPHYSQVFLNAFSLLLPISGIYVFAMNTFCVLDKKTTKKFSIKNRSCMNLNTKSKYGIIIMTYLIQWTIPCIFILIEPFLGENDDRLILGFKWTTYTAALTDPLVLLVFDYNLSVFFKSKKVSNSGTHSS